MPEDPYGIAKYAVELELKASNAMFGLPYVIFRPHNIYGERQNIGDKYRNVVGIFMNQIMQGQPLTIFGDGNQKRAFSYISDVAPVIAHSINFPGAVGNVFNVGADVPYTVNELATEVCTAFDRKAEIRHLPERQEVYEAYCDHSKVRTVFSSEAKVPLSEGIRKMANWAKKHGARKSKDFDNIEIPINLPASWAPGQA